MKDICLLLFCKQRGGQITVTGIRQNNDDVFAFVFGTFCKLDCCPYCRTGGNAYQHAFLMTDLSAGCKRILILYGDNFVINPGVQYVRYEACADSLDLVCAGCALAQNRRACRLYSNNLYISLFAL